MCCLVFFGFMRCSEFIVLQQDKYDSSMHLSLADIALDSRSLPRTVRVRTKQSKTDPFHQGINIYLGRTDQDVCPVWAIMTYLGIRGSTPGPLFVLPDRRLLTHKIFSSALDNLLCKLRIDKGNTTPIVSELGQQLL